MKADFNKPIDFVMIWVDGNDPEWRKEKAQYDGSVITSANSEVRYRDWDNLQYWFRAVEQYAPWVNKIHFVTWGHLPPWLDTTNPKLHIVNHKDYIPEEYLPTFSSHTIELNLHRIEGLADQFVYFNDDTFLNKPVKPEDFFKDGLPLDVGAINCIYFGKDSAGFFHAADLVIINSYFRKKAVMKKDWKKWYNPKNGYTNLAKNVLLYPWLWFPGFYNQHVSNNYLKSTFETVWEKEFDVLDETCRHKFRKNGDVNQWVMKYWQLASGQFNVRRGDFALCYHVKKKNYRRLCRDLKWSQHSIVCINDNARTTHFETKKRQIRNIFERKFPERSSFEKPDYVYTFDYEDENNVTVENEVVVETPGTLDVEDEA